jgi:hypothetical protein
VRGALRRYGSALAVTAVFVLLFLCMMPVLLGRDATRDHSAFRKNAWGCAALAELCRRADPPLPVETRTQPLEDLAELRGALLVLDPGRSLASSELDAVLGWVEAGGTLIVALEGPLDDPTAVGLRAAPPSMALAQALGLQMSEADGLIREADPVRGSTLAEGVGRVATHTRYTLVTASEEGAGERHVRLDSDDLQLHLTAEGEPILASFQHGQGQVFVSSDAGMFANRRLAQADNVQLMANLLWPHAADGGVTFDEYHHGFGTRVRPGSAPDPAPLNRALIVIAVGVAAFLLGKAQRFGAPVEVFDPRRRAAMEYVEALAGLLARGEANQWALGRIAAASRRRLTAAVGLPSSTPGEALAATLAERRGIAAEETTRLLADVEAGLGSGSVSSRRVAELVHRMTDLEERAARHPGGSRKGGR